MKFVEFWEKIGDERLKVCKVCYRRRRGCWQDLHAYLLHQQHFPNGNFAALLLFPLLFSLLRSGFDCDLNAGETLLFVIM